MGLVQDRQKATTQASKDRYSQAAGYGAKTIAGITGRDPALADGVAEAQDQFDAKNRAEEIGQELLGGGYNQDEADLYAQDQIEPMDAAYFDASEASAESYGRRGLGMSGMAQAEQSDMAQKRVRAIDDIVLRSQAAAQAKRRSDLQQELQAQISIQTSDINAQRLAMEQQAQYDAILADAVAALGEAGGGALADYFNKKKEANATPGVAPIWSNG